MTQDAEGVKARFGRDDMLALVKEAGRKVIGGRVQCPLECCKDAGEKARANCSIYRGQSGWLLHCHVSKKTVDYIALYQVVKGVPDFKTALEQLAGVQPAKPAPHLRVVRGAPPSTEGKRSSDEVRSIWNSLEPHDDAGRAYLERRHLAELIELGFVRFATDASALPEMKSKAREGYRVAMLLADLTGRPLGIQFRNVEPESPSDKVRSLSKGMGSGVFFGRPGDVLDSHTVVVTEGMADTLTALWWTRERQGVCVVGAPGTGGVPKLADALELAGVDLVGRTFVLLAQHDRGPRGNSSLVAFTALKQRLQQGGATVLLESQPPGDNTKDWADAWKEQALPEWPPEQLRRSGEARDVEAEDTMVRAPGAAVWQAREPVEPQQLGKDLTTLEYLLSSQVHREPILGAGDWELNQMTGRVEYGRRQLERADYTRIRIQLETYRGGMDNRRLKFSIDDITAIARVLADRRAYHPVREYLTGLKYDGVSVLPGLSAALGLDPEKHGLQEEYLRRWLIAAVARAMQPGCQADTMLVLFGAQGMYKSRFFEALGGQWYRTTSAELGSLQSVEILRTAWLVELDEMDSIIRAREASSVKAFLSRSYDDVVRKYEPESTRFQRSSIFAGTVNEPAFLADLTGNRRYWVVELHRKLELEWVKANRDALWAEAVHLYRAGEKWRLDDEHEALRAQANEHFEVQHPWQAAIEEYIERKLTFGVRIPELLSDPLQLPAAQQTPGAARQVASILRKLGWALKLEGGTARSRVWRPAS